VGEGGDLCSGQDINKNQAPNGILMDCAWWGVGGGGPKEVNKGHGGETITETVESQKDNLAQISTFSNKVQWFHMRFLNSFTLKCQI
jgi:hypothetical protein